MRVVDIYDERMMKIEWKSALDGLTYSLNQIGKDHDVELLCLCMPNEAPSQIQKENFRIKLVKNHDELLKEIHSLPPDRLLLNGVGHIFNQYLCMDRFFSRTWKAIYYHGGALVDSCFSHVNRILVQTADQKRRLQAVMAPYFATLDELIGVVPFGSDPLLFKKLDVEKKYTLTYQGTFAAIKRNILAAQTMTEVSGRHLLFGRPYSQQVVDACLRLQRAYPDKLDVEPVRVAHTEVPAKLNSGVVGFLAGIEGGTRGLSEYVNCGIPIVTFADSNSVAEEVARNGCGIVVKSASEVSSAVKEILTSYSEYRKKAVEYANRELLASVMCRKLEVALELE